MYSFQISYILLDHVFPYIPSFFISVTSSIIFELVKHEPTISHSTIRAILDIYRLYVFAEVMSKKIGICPYLYQYSLN